ncbi:MAG: 5-deoxy-glucuronate isomerase, partial [Chloroflexota bacterium]
MNYTAETLLIRSKDTGSVGVFAEVSAAQAGWDFLNMAARRLNTGETWRGSTGDNEYVHVILGGVCTIRTSQGNFERVGRRRDVFSGMPYA